MDKRSGDPIERLLFGSSTVKTTPTSGLRRSAERGFTLVETLIVVGLIGVIGVIAAPMFSNSLANMRISGDARSVSNAIALTKMRAASNFSRVRLFVDLSTSTHHIEWLDKAVTPAHWTTEGGSTALSTGVSFSFGVVTTAPPNTQAIIAQAPQCTTDAGAAIANTACVVFNSRGVPVDASFAPTSLDALYVTDGMAVYAATVAATGMVRLWRTLPVATPTWVLN
jgi:prepilin-type N-terminal cleavage/methylation domain-containing protein